MTTSQALTRPTAVSTVALGAPTHAPLLSPVRAMKAYGSWRQIKRLDARQLADVGMTADQRDTITYMDVFAKA